MFIDNKDDEDAGLMVCNVNKVMPANLTDTEEMQVIHNLLMHPGNTKSKAIHKFYEGKGFPTDYLALLEKHACVTCAIMKGARDYQHSARMKLKMQNNSNRSQLKSKSLKTSSITESVTDLAICKPCSVTATVTDSAAAGHLASNGYS